MTPEGNRVIRGRRDLFYDLCGRFDLVNDPKCHGVIRSHRDLLCDPKGHGDLCGRFYLDYDPQKIRDH